MCSLLVLWMNIFELYYVEVLFGSYMPTSGVVSSLVDVYIKIANEKSLFSINILRYSFVSSHGKAKMACVKPFDDDRRIFMKILGVKVDGEFEFC